MGLYANLNEIKNIKEQIKQSISDKGIDMADVPFGDYPTKISEIETGGGDGRLNVKLTGAKFIGYNFTDVPEWVDFTGTEDYSRMFYTCTSLAQVSGIDWTSAKDTSEMFYGAGKNGNGFEFDTIFPKDKYGYSTDNLDLPNVTKCHNMFSNLKFSIMSRTGYDFIINIPKVGETSRMFNNFTCADSHSYPTEKMTVSVYAPRTNYCSSMFNGAIFSEINVSAGTIENGSYMFANVKDTPIMNGQTGLLTDRPIENIYLDMTKIKKAGGIFENTMVDSILTYGDWSQATIDATSFTCRCRLFDCLSYFKGSDIYLPYITFNSEKYRLKNFIQGLGQPTNALNLYLNSEISDIVDDEIITLALNKNWIISFI